MKVSSVCTCSAVMATTAAAFTAPAGPHRVRTPLAAEPPTQAQAQFFQLNTLEAEELIQLNTLEAEEPGTSMYDGTMAAVPPGQAPTFLNGGLKMSAALPFLAQPDHLDGTLAGDAGFDPFGFSAMSPGRLVYMREAEVRHARLAMLAVAGWLAEESAGYRPLLQYGGRAPSVLNGGLGEALAPFFPAFAAILVFAGVVEVFQDYTRTSDPEGYASKAIGDIGFDPLGLYNARGRTAEARLSMGTAELKHGRLAMLAITAFALQEDATGVGVATQIQSWLHPHSAEFLAEGGYASNVQAILAGDY